jgi:cytochrome c2
MPAFAGMTALCTAMFVLTATACAQQGDAARGEQKFVECAACHSIEKGVNNVGPTLAGIFGRKAGTLADYRYSASMRKSGITWTPQTLDQYIADPQNRIPANRMPYAGLPDAAARADLIAYLEKVTK